jgi:phospholipid/cholesterol/gamma-HCH transport system permease protein
MTIFYHFGRYLLFLKSMFSRPERFAIYYKRTMMEMNSIGLGSLPIVAIISLFIGGVTTLQIAYQLVTGLVPSSIIGSIVSDSTILEFAPTITCLVLAGRVGSSIASEIGTMKVSEQIDALEVMGINSSGFLALPKIIAALFMIPILIMIAMGLSIWGGMLVGDLTEILPSEAFVRGARSSFRGFTVTFALIKAAVYAFIITSISAYQGYYTTGGALEVGTSSTRAVVYSSVAILFADYMLAQLLL